MRDDDRVSRLINEFADRVQARAERELRGTATDTDPLHQHLPALNRDTSLDRPPGIPSYMQASRGLVTDRLDEEGPPLAPMTAGNVRAIEAIMATLPRVPPQYDLYAQISPAVLERQGIWASVDTFSSDELSHPADDTNPAVDTPVSVPNPPTREEPLIVTPSPIPYDNLHDYQQSLINKESRPDVMASLYLSLIQYGFTSNTGKVFTNHDMFRREATDSRKVYVFGNSFKSSGDITRICANLDKRSDTLLISIGLLGSVDPAILLHIFNQSVAKWFTPVANGVIVRVPTVYQALPEGLLLLGGVAYRLTRKDICRGFISRINEISLKDFDWIINRGVKPLEPPSRSTVEITTPERSKKKLRSSSSPYNMTFQRL